MTRPYHPSPGLRASDIVWPRTDGYEPIEPASGNHFHTCACGAVWEHAIPEGDTCGDPDDTCEECAMVEERDALSDKGLMHASEAVEQAYYRKLKKGGNNAE